MKTCCFFSAKIFVVLFALVCAVGLFAQDFKKQVIYEIVVDRFVDGDTTNDNPAESAGLYDSTKTNWHAYWGGDLAGIQQKMAYLKGMGITAIWISPPVDNENVNTYGTPSAPQAGYHGYWARDFQRIEEHFGDAKNMWTAFDALVAAAHANGMKVIVDFAANHTSPQDTGEFGALYKNGTLMGNFTNDTQGYFHHNPGIDDYSDRYKVQYYNLDGLADLNQEHPVIDAYLKTAMGQFESHKVDGFRLDAVKHVTWGWEYSMANTVFSGGPSFLFGEWSMTNTADALFGDATKFSNKSGINLLDFPMNTAMRDVFANDSGFGEIDATVTQEAASFTWPNDLVTFVDSQDLSRLLSMRNDNDRLNEALAFQLTARGIPVIYYGDEQYLHNDTGGGGDPYNRPQMVAFGMDTTAYKLIAALSGLRQTNDAIAYGTSKQRWINDDVYVFERQFFNDVVLVAINKNKTNSAVIANLNTALPAGSYADFLGGLLNGTGLTVGAGSGGSNPASAVTLGASSVSVWQVASAATTPSVGSIGPTVGQPGMVVTIAGDGFGAGAGSVVIGAAGGASVAAKVKTWTNTAVSFTVPKMVGGVYQAQLKSKSGVAANSIQFTVLTGKLVPVTFTVSNAVATNPGDYIFLSGNTVELGQWGTTFATAVGPMLDPNYPNWFLDVSVPAGQTIQFKFLKIAADGTVTWEGGANHSYAVPASGVGTVNVNWQN
jgi:glycosidase